MTLALPPAAAPWAAWLSELVPELRPAVLDAVVALDRMLGPMAPLPDPGAVEPTGLDGLRRRGPYERLLLSEWVLADELPDEFLRRAAAGEHLFHELSRVVPRRGRRCLVLLDTGPAQLGGPRLVQLALLVVFARRAERAGATLAWASLQDGTWWGPGALRTFPALRRARSAGGADVRACLEAQGPAAPTDEVFVVGGEDVGALAGTLPAIALTEPVTGEGDVVRVRVRRPGSAGVTRDLPLPAPEVRARWIRDPFRAPEGARVAPAREPGARAAATWSAPLRPFLRFSTDGNRVLAEEEGTGAALAFRIPEGRDPPKRPIRVVPRTPGARLVALGWSKGRLHAVHRRPTGELDWHLPRGEPAAVQPFGEGDDPGDLLTWLDGGAPRGWLRTADGRLQVWRGTGAATELRSSRCLAVARRDGRPYWWGLRPDGTIDVLDAQDHVAGPSVHGPTWVVVGSGGGRWGHVLAGDGQRTWSSWAGDWIPVDVPPGVRVVGAPAGWVGYGPDGRSPRTKRGALYLRGTELYLRWLHPEPEPERRLASGVVAAAGGTLHLSLVAAWLEPPSTVVVWNFGNDTEVVRWSPP